MTGTPQFHLLYLGHLSGLLLSALYACAPSIPWYGIFLFSCMYLSLFLAYIAIAKQIEKTSQKVIFSITSTLIICSFLLYHLTNIQYTTVTATVCATSLLYFYLAKEDHNPRGYLKNCIPSLLLFALSIEIRSEACIMFLPTFFAIGLCKLLKECGLFKSIAAYGCALLVIIITVSITENLFYSSPAWNEFREYNSYRQQVVDYGGYPNYDENKETYDALGINYQSYVAASSRYQLLLDDNINASFMKKMAELSPRSAFNPDSMIKTFIEKHLYSYQDRPLNLIVYVLYFFLFVLILYSRNWKALLNLMAIIAGRMVIWTYLLYIGRCPARVTQGIYIAELLLLAAMLFADRLVFVNKPTGKKSPAHAAINILLLYCIVATSIKWGIPHTVDSFKKNASQLIYSSAYGEIRDYFYNNSSNLYLLDTNSFSYFTENIFAPTLASANNFVLMGSWAANSPWTDEIVNRYGFSSYENALLTGNNVFFVFIDSPETNHNYLTNYISSKFPNYTLNVSDSLTTSNGVTFIILKIVQP